jgi:hypothetical protein
MTIEIVDSKVSLTQLEIKEKNRLPFVDDHFSMEAFRQREVVLEDGEKKRYSLGAHYNGYGKGIVKGGNLCFRVKVIDGKEMLELDFKINHAFRTYLAGLLNERKQDSDRFLVPQQIKGEMGGYQDQLIEHYTRKLSKVEGSISIGADPQQIGLYTRVIVQVPVTFTLTDLQNFLSELQLDVALTPFSSEDLERLKVGYLFHLFSPARASFFERDLKFYLLSASALKAQIILQDPKMKEIYEKYLPKIEPYKPLKGRVRYRINGLGKECQDLGAQVLITSIFAKDDVNRAVSMLKMGLISTELRLASNMGIQATAAGDLERGSSDSVFVQLVTSAHYQEGHLRPYGFSQNANVTFLLDLNLLETGTYQYNFIDGGTRGLFKGYQNRPPLLNFVKREMEDANQTNNEVMIKDRIPPSAIKGIRVGDEKTRQALLQKIREAGLIENKEGVETIFQCPVHQFIQLKTIFPSQLNGFVNIVTFNLEGDRTTHIVEDLKGQQFILRQAKVGSLLSEHSIANAYRVLGVAVPEAALYIDINGLNLLLRGIEGNPTAILSTHVKGIKISQYLDPSNPLYTERLKEVQELAKKGFVADCLLGNWEPSKNMIIDVESKKIWRTRHSSGLAYKTFNERKSLQMCTSKIQEFQILRDPKINPFTAQLFATVTDEEIIQQIDTLLPKKEALLATLHHNSDKELMKERFESLKQYRASLITGTDIYG